MPIYNTASYLRRCIESIINQNYKTIEVILVNDGSTDESLNICLQYKMADSRIHIVDKINGGLSSARNAGIDVATGKYICFIDSDDFLESNFIEELVDGFRLHPNVDVTICNYFYNEFDVRACVRTHESGDEIRNRTLTMIEIASPKSFKGFVWNKLYKMDVITRNSLRFDESAVLVEDALFNQLFMSHAYYSLYIDIPLYHYVQREGSLLHSSFNKEKLEVLPTYEKIFQICKFEDNDELNKLLSENYLSHVITLMKMLIKDSENKSIYFQDLKKYCLDSFHS